MNLISARKLGCDFKVIGLIGLLLICTVLSCLLTEAQPLEIWSERIFDGGLGSIDVSPDGTLVAAGSFGEGEPVKLLRVEDGGLIAALMHEEVQASVSFSPDGKLLATAGRRGFKVSSLRIWDAQSHESVMHFDVPAARLNPPLVFSPDSQFLASIYTTNVGIWRVSDGELVNQIELVGQMGALPINSISFSPDGERLGIATGIRGYGVGIHIVDFPGGDLERLVLPEYEYGVFQIAFSPDSARMASSPHGYPGFQGSVEVRRVSDGEVLTTIPVKAVALAFSPDGAVLATTRHDANSDSSVVEFWRVSDGKLLAAYEDVSPTNGYHTRIQFVPDGSRVVIGGYVNLQIGESISPRGTLTMIHAPVFFSDVRLGQPGKLKLHWTGGSGPFQIQYTSGLMGEWADLGAPVSGNTVEIPVPAEASFFRLRRTSL